MEYSIWKKPEFQLFSIFFAILQNTENKISIEWIWRGRGRQGYKRDFKRPCDIPDLLCFSSLSLQIKDVPITFPTCQPLNTPLGHPGLFSYCPSIPVTWDRRPNPCTGTPARSPCPRGACAAVSDAEFGKAVDNSDCCACQPPSINTASSAKPTRAKASVRRKEEKKRGKIDPEIQARNRPAEQDVTFLQSLFWQRS